MRKFKRMRSRASSYAFFVGDSRRPRTRKERIAWSAFLVLAVLPVLFSGAIYFWIYDSIPSADAVLTHRPSLSTYVYDSQDRLIGTFAAEKRRLVSLSAISPKMRQAIIAVEDERFYQHWGIDPVGIVRAAFHNMVSRTISQGASTVTQQLVRFLILTRERSWKRKIVEAITAIKLEATLSKDQILERYLNLVYFGRGAYGVAAAARIYFNKSAAELDTAEAALLAGMVQAPGRFRPFVDPGPSLERRAHVLRRMAVAGFIPKEEADALSNAPLALKSPEEKTAVSHFLEYIRRRLEEKYGSQLLYHGGLRVYTTLNSEYQSVAEAAVKKGIARLVKRRWPEAHLQPDWQPPEAALLALDPKTGAIRAMVGGSDFRKSKFNRAVQALRQPGSAFKPVVYAAAVDVGFSPADSVLDAPIVMKGGGDSLWKPQNYAKNFQGRLSLRNALAESRNTVSVRLVRTVGIQRLVEFARLLGIKSPISPTLSSALGSSVVTLPELTAAYGVFASGGYYNTPYAFRRVEDSEGKVYFQAEVRPTQVIRPEVAYVITHMLKGVVERGTARRVSVLGRPIAGKTGTTNSFRDNWFIGYSPRLVVSVWMGFDQPQSLGPGETGGRNAVPVFVDFFREAMNGLPVEDFIPPPGVEFVRVDRATGLLATLKSRSTDFEVFLRGTAPTRFADSLSSPQDSLFRSEGFRSLRPGSGPAARR
ncbi:MAG: PBP1A family penicillin-binding protein [bacterium]|nr:PBP1A family penicillin-binding protein [bacterium]